jgi:hypothetical protein
MKYIVSITDAMEGDVIHKLYAGDDYQAAFDKACDARSIKEWHGKWIKFETPEKVKWAAIS